MNVSRCVSSQRRSKIVGFVRDAQSMLWQPPEHGASNLAARLAFRSTLLAGQPRLRSEPQLLTSVPTMSCRPSVSFRDRA